jgi:hypothetical protein
MTTQGTGHTAGPKVSARESTLTDLAGRKRTVDPMPRNERGQAVSRKCPDMNCGGMLVYEPRAATWSGPAQHYWRCDGLTHERADDELDACPYEICGPAIPRARASMEADRG